MTNGAAPKIMVAVHGVGDQLTNETIRSVAAQVCRYYHREGTVPLGTFHPLEGPEPPTTFMIDLPQGVPSDIGFAEVYWAGIARRVASGGYVLEDARMWAKTIVARVQASATKGGMSPTDCLLVENVLEELIDTVRVVDRLCSIASKAGLFTVNLQRVLDQVVNDVQLVADFQPYRNEILGAFHKLMGTVLSNHRTAEIYIVAHSEGTVVALAGLLSAIGNPDGIAVDGPTPIRNRDWLDRVRGIMTIGSPLDTHMLLWKGLWKPLTPQRGRWTTETPIPWHNYFDRGDPIADSLRTTKQWLDDNCPGAFAITVDHGFSRFYFPGKAHIDYWHDEYIFGYFIEEVTGLPADPLPPEAAAAGQPPMPPVVPAAQPSAKPSPKRHYPQKPKSKRTAQVFSYIAPYALIGLLCYAAIFILYKAVTDYLGNMPGPAIYRDVLTLAFLLAGMTIAVRIPRLSSMWRWRVVGFAFFALAVAWYVWPIYKYDAPLLVDGKRVSQPLRGMQDMIAWDVFKPLFEFLGLPAGYAVCALPVGAVIVVLVCMAFGRSKHNRAGMRILLSVGGAFVLLIVVGLVLTVGDHPRPLWPVVLGSAAFFYLWWLAALLFDLVFVWHRYIRHSAAMGDLRALQAKPAASTRTTAA